MEVSGKLNERLGAHQGVFQEYSARGASRATTLFTVLVLVSKGNRAAILGRPPRWLYFNRLWAQTKRRELPSALVRAVVAPWDLAVSKFPAILDRHTSAFCDDSDS